MQVGTCGMSLGDSCFGMAKMGWRPMNGGLHRQAYKKIGVSYLLQEGPNGDKGIRPHEVGGSLSMAICKR